MVFNATGVKRSSGAQAPHDLRALHGQRPPQDDPESRAQQALIRTVRENRLVMPELRFFHSCPNSTRTSAQVAGRMKREGVERGAFDLFWDLGRGGWHGLRIEMKAQYADGRHGYLSEEQKDFAAFYAAQGVLAVACLSEHEAWSVIRWYYGLVPTPRALAVPLPPALAGMAAPTVHHGQSPETAAKRQATFAQKRAANWASTAPAVKRPIRG